MNYIRVLTDSGGAIDKPFAGPSWDGDSTRSVVVQSDVPVTIVAADVYLGGAFFQHYEFEQPIHLRPRDSCTVTFNLKADRTARPAITSPTP